MSLLRDNSLSWVIRLGIKVLKMGRIPNHIAFIMDGNRRYAEKNKFKKIKGHKKGYEELADTLQRCGELGIREFTLYAFSIENFKRSPEEVADLMELALQKFQIMLDEKEKYKKRGIRVRVIGQLSLLPVEVRKIIAEIMKITENNTPSTLNIAFPYTGREEITQAVSAIVTGVANGDLAPEDVSEDLISNCMYTSPSRNPELLIRTSGEVRLSDFLPWQTSFSCIYFTEKLWPEFGLWDMLLAILHYQRSYEHLAVYQEGHYSTRVPSRTSGFIASVKESRQLEPSLIASADPVTYNRC